MWIDVLKKYLADYEKTKEYYTKQNQDIYLKFKPKLEEAIQNAQLLGEFNEHETHKSVSEMYKIYIYLKTLTKQSMQ